MTKEEEQELNGKLEELRTGRGDVVESTLVTIASFFPIASSLATGWSEWKNNKQTQNIHDILIKYFEQLTSIQDKVDEDYIKTEEAKRLLERTTLMGRDESREEKRKILADFLANSSTKYLSRDEEKDMILDVIDRVSPYHVKLLKLVTQLLVMQYGVDNARLGANYNPDSLDKPTFYYIQEQTIVNLMAIRISSVSVEASLDFLISVGLIEGANARGWTQIGGKSGIKGFRPTKLGLRVLEFLGVEISSLTSKKLDIL